MQEALKPDNDELVMSLVEMALALPSEERQHYLRRACSDNVQLLDEAWSRVQWGERMKGFLEEPALPPAEDEQRLEPGAVLEHRFRIVREVGQGGMGVVYEAWDEKLGCRVALKCAKPGFRKRLPPEVRHAREITHPNVCKIFEIHSTSLDGDEFDFITMEFLEGETLAERMRRGPVGKEEARLIARQLCEGLAEAHRTEVIHGDLKSNNVILTALPDGGIRAVITDFGLASRRTTARLAAWSSERGGTLDYMAPELLKGGKTSVASDLYGLGVILHELAAGRLPFQAETRPVSLTSTTSSVRSGPAIASWQDRLTRNPPPVKHPWKSILRRCLDPDPGHRFPNADEVARALAPVDLRPWLGIAATLALLAGTIAYVDSYRAKTIPSLAVIPFVNDGAPESEYLSDGISEGLINALAQLPDLKVIARTSSFKVKGQKIELRQAARSLGVQMLVTGRVAETGGRFRITAELVDGSDGTQIWGDQYFAAISGLAGVEAAISREIAARIRSALTQNERAKLAQSTRVKPEAYELLLRGRYQLRLYTPESKQKAVSYYQQALAVDPGFALANAELANAYRLLSGSAVLSATDMMPKAEAAARRALAADKDLAEAHAALAHIKRDQWDWASAESAYRRALELNPNLAAAHQGFATYLSVTGRHEAALAEVQRARELDPLSLPAAIGAAAVHYNARRYSEALRTLKNAVDSDPTAPAAWTWIGIVNGGSGQFATALAAYEAAIGWGDHTAATQCYYAYSLARSGKRDQALEILQRLERSKAFVPHSTLAIIHLGLNQTERAWQSLQAAYSARDPLLQYLKVESHYDSLKSDRRFQELAAKIGLSR